MGPVIGFALDNTVKYKWQCDSSKPETQEAPLFYLSSQGFVFSIRSLYTLVLSEADRHMKQISAQAFIRHRGQII